MALTRSMTKRPWSDLGHDLLILVMMQLGVIDFLAFSGTCTTWRSIARSNKNKFMGSRLPMTISCSTKECCLHDYKGRKFKTVLPHYTGRMCVGITCGYLILFGRKTRDFWLVNPITRHELCFDDVPFRLDNDTTKLRAVLVYSPSMSKWVFMITFIYKNIIWFCSAGKKACWDKLYTDLAIHDIHAFEGKIYIIYGSGRLLCEMRLHPYPILKLLEMKNSPMAVLLSEFVSSGEKLYVFGFDLEDPREVLQLDFDKMIWVSSENTLGEYAIFLSKSKCGVAIKPETWAESGTQYERLVYFVHNKTRIDRRFATNMWYFPHDCLNENRLRE